MTSREPDERHISTADGRTLATRSWGIGMSTVVMEAALGASGLTWHAVAQKPGPDVHVLAYDRPGIGRSTRVIGHRSLALLAADLAAVVGPPAARASPSSGTAGAPPSRVAHCPSCRPAPSLDCSWSSPQWSAYPPTSPARRECYVRPKVPSLPHWREHRCHVT